MAINHELLYLEKKTLVLAASAERYIFKFVAKRHQMAI